MLKNQDLSDNPKSHEPKHPILWVICFSWFLSRYSPSDSTKQDLSLSRQISVRLLSASSKNYLHLHLPMVLFSPWSIICHGESLLFEEERSSEASFEASTTDPLKIYSAGNDTIPSVKTIVVTCLYQSQCDKLPKALSLSGKLASCSLGQQDHPQRTCQSVCFKVADQTQSVCVISCSASECAGCGELNVAR